MVQRHTVVAVLDTAVPQSTASTVPRVTLETWEYPVLRASLMVLPVCLNLFCFAIIFNRCSPQLT